jgi:hypothetical protein
MLPIMAGLGAASGALGNRKSARTSTSKETVDKTTTEKSSGKKRKYMTPEQAAAMSQVSGLSSEMMTDPAKYLEPQRQYARTQANANFSGVDDIIRQKFGTGGGARDGRAGAAGRAAELARLGALTGVDADFAKLISEERFKGANLGMGLLGLDMGSDIEGESTQRTQGTSEGEQVRAGDPWSGAMGGGLSGIMGALAGKEMGVFTT